MVGLVMALAGTTAGPAKAEKPRFGGVYDCSYTLHKRFGAPDIVLKRNGRYATARKHRGNRLIGRVRTGRYRLRRDVITFRTGPLKPPPGVPPSYYDKPHNRLQVFQLRPAAVPWDCVRPGLPDLTR